MTGKTNGCQINGLFWLLRASNAKTWNLDFYPEDKGELLEAFGQTKGKLCCRLLSLEVDDIGLENSEPDV